MRSLVRNPRAAALLRIAPALPLVVLGLVASGRPRAQELRTTAATGNVKLADSRGGGAIVSAADMSPGRSVSGSVTISNSGDAAAAVTLAKSDLQDTPGTGGGVLSQALWLEVDDAASSRRVYEGPLGSMGPISVDPIPAGGQARFDFTVTMAHVSSDTYGGASTNVRFDWGADPAAGGGAGSGTGTGTGGSGTGTGGGGGTTTPPPPGGDVRAPVVRLSGAKVQRAGKGGLTLFAVCDERCTLAAAAKVTGVKGVRSGRARVRPAVALPGQKAKIAIGFPKKALAKLRKPSKRAQAVVTVRATDGAGNRASKRFTIKLRR